MEANFDVITLPSISIGHKFGRLTICEVLKKSGTFRYYAKCKCECGKEKIIRIDGLKNGSVVSCGCYHKEVTSTHHLTNHPLFDRWKNMIDRCTNEKCHAYKNYGGRGIKVCERWMSVENFVEDMYPTYVAGLQLDRIDNDGDYKPENVKWSSVSENCNNRRSGRKLEFNGQIKSISQWAKQYNLSVSTLWERIAIWKWTIESAITTPPLTAKERMKRARDVKNKR